MTASPRQYPLTRRQAQLKTFLAAHFASSEAAPSFEQMRKALRVKTKSVVHLHITELERRGHIVRAKLPGTRGRDGLNRVVKVLPDPEFCSHCGRPVDA